MLVLWLPMSPKSFQFLPQRFFRVWYAHWHYIAVSPAELWLILLLHGGNLNSVIKRTSKVVQWPTVSRTIHPRKQRVNEISRCLLAFRAFLRVLTHKNNAQKYLSAITRG